MRARCDRFLGILLFTFSLALAAGDPAWAACREDADCRLIYSSCLCESVPIDDPRTHLPSEVDCAVNRCRYERLEAACIAGSCGTRPAPKSERSR